MDGNIIKISRFCTHDGPGIRTVVFLKGCPLKCIWCHNPESQKTTTEILYDSQKCIKCKQCYQICDNNSHSFRDNLHSFNLEKCDGCGKCVEVCQNKALDIVGKKLSTEQVMKEIEKDTVFYQTSSGGVTVSGGEPLCQPEFTAELLKKCKGKGIHTAIETSGFGDLNSFETVIRFCDLVLFDIKETDEKNHKRFTGVSLKKIYDNLNCLNKSGVDFVVRLPIIPGLNDREEHFYNIKNLIEGMQSCKGVEVMPYHILGVYKYAQLQREYLCVDIKEPTQKTINKWNEWLKRNDNL